MHRSAHPTLATSAALAGLCVLVLLGLPAWGQNQTPSPIQTPSEGQIPDAVVVEADSIVYDQVAQLIEAEGNVRLRYRGIRLTAARVEFDLRQEQLTAEGRVVLIDAQGRELRGRRIRYDVRLQMAEVEQAQAIVDRVYVSSARLQARPDRVVAEDALVTTCDPAHPAYRVTAASVEVVPGQELIARNATLWIGARRIISLPVLTMSLRSGEETAGSFARAGYNNVDGLWVDYPYGYHLGPLDGLLYIKQAWRTGTIVRNTLAYTQPRYRVSLTVGRNQNNDQLIFDQAEMVVDLPSSRLGPLPLFYGLTLRSGWFIEPSTGVATSRSQYGVTLATPTIALGAQTTLAAAAGLQDAYYGTGARQTIASADVTVTHRLNEQSSLSLHYGLLDRIGGTPFLFDAVADDDLLNKVGLQYTRTVPRGPGVTVTYGGGVSYNFRDQTSSVSGVYGARVEGVHHWSLGAEYDLTTQATKLTTDSGIAVGHGTYVTVQAAYFPQTGQFEDLDVLLTSRLCGCFNLSVKYRHVRHELWVEIGLAPDVRVAFPQEGQ